jgi:Ca2+-binding EF-hand superfamily protein
VDFYAAGMRLALAAVLAAFLSPLAAQTRGDADEALFRKLDTNRDGYLSRQELSAPVATQYSWIAVDRNRDGRISRDEFGEVRNLAAAPATGAAGGTRSAPQPKASERP